MHSLGRVVLGTLYPTHYRRAIKQCEESNESLIDQEAKVFPVTGTKLAMLGRFEF